MSTKELAYSMIDELTEEELNALVVILKSMHKTVKERYDDVDRICGIFHDAADPMKIPFEKKAWEEAAVEKYLRIEEEINENP